jgi:hypothetical protein
MSFFFEGLKTDKDLARMVEHLIHRAPPPRNNKQAF